MYEQYALLKYSNKIIEKPQKIGYAGMYQYWIFSVS